MLVLSAALMPIAYCKPWTVVPIEDETNRAPSKFDAVAYVESIWTPKVLPEAKTAAVELREAAAAASPRFVRGQGIVTRVDTRSRVGLAFVDLAPADGREDVAIQVGPVLRGTALRDALSFIRFGDFSNQLAYADVANALNGRVASSVVDHIEPAALVGDTVTFWGAMKPNVSGGPPDIVPVILESDAR